MAFVYRNGSFFRVPIEAALEPVVSCNRQVQWFNSGYDEAISGRVLIFGRKSYKQWMHMVRRVFVDGTFKIAPPLFEQVFVVLAERDGFVFPIATALLPNKRMITYRKFFGLLQDVFETLISTALSCDFKLGIQNAAKEIWQDVSIDGCYWHLCANLYKHLQGEGLSVRYGNDVMFAYECRKVVAMACVPIPNLNVAFQALRENLPDELAPIMHWFENNYLGAMNPNGHRRTARFPIDSWNLVDRIMNDEARTNNYAEAYHKKVANQLGIAHPTLWKFIDVMKLVQRGVDGVYAEMTLGRDPPIKRLKYRKADDRIKKNVVKASCSWHLFVPFEYLGSIASNFRMAQGPYEEPVGQAADEEEVYGGDAFYQQEENLEMGKKCRERNVRERTVRERTVRERSVGKEVSGKKCPGRKCPDPPVRSQFSGSGRKLTLSNLESERAIDMARASKVILGRGPEHSQKESGTLKGVANRFAHSLSGVPLSIRTVGCESRNSPQGELIPVQINGTSSLMRSTFLWVEDGHHTRTMKGSADQKREVVLDAPDAKRKPWSQSVPKSPLPSPVEASNQSMGPLLVLPKPQVDPAKRSIQNTIVSPCMYCNCESPSGSRLNKINPLHKSCVCA